MAIMQKIVIVVDVRRTHLLVLCGISARHYFLTVYHAIIFRGNIVLDFKRQSEILFATRHF